jgi:hypothetical protein
VVPVIRIRGFGAVGGHRAALRGAHADGEDRQLLAPERLGRGVEVPFPALAVGDDQDRPAAGLAFVLERADGGEQRGGHIGGRVAQVVRARRVEEEPERRAIGGERQLEERAPSEDHQAHPVAGEG